VPDILSLDATGQLAALESKRISAVELLEASVARYEAVNPQLNAVVRTDLDHARARARSIDLQRAAGEHMGHLAGLPMTIKDSLDVDGMPATSGLAALLKRTARDAVVVSLVKAQGAVVWGKTNVPVMTADWQSYNKLYGTTNNPWDLSRGPGGSSGGAAAALAAGVTPLEIGSDIGGSLRVPAAMCGVFSHKPTYGMVSQRGHVPPAPGSVAERDLNVVGPMARSARDLRLLLSVLEDGPLAAKAPPAELRGLKVGLWIDEPGFPLDPEVRAVVEGFAQALAGHGCVVQPVRPLDASALLGVYRLLLAAAMAPDQPPSVLKSMERMRGTARLAQRISGGRAAWAGPVLANTISHTDWLAANEARARFGLQLRPVFERHDILIAPITPVAAFPHDHGPFNRRRLTLSDGRKIAYGAMLNWISMATACGLPATAFPAGLTPAGLPVGVQIIGPRGGDGRTLDVALAIEEALGGFVPPPPLPPTK
jgi:amidase